MSSRYPNSPLRYFVVYKPYGMLSQFTNEGTEHATLADLGPFPPDVYAVGRLDSDSEGLLILTNDNRLNKRLLDPTFGHHRTYLAQVEGSLTPEAIEQLQHSIIINVNGKNTKPCLLRLVSANNLIGLPNVFHPFVTENRYLTPGSN